MPLLAALPDLEKRRGCQSDPDSRASCSEHQAKSGRPEGLQWVEISYIKASRSLLSRSCLLTPPGAWILHGVLILRWVLRTCREQEGCEQGALREVKSIFRGQGGEGGERPGPVARLRRKRSAPFAGFGGSYWRLGWSSKFRGFSSRPPAFQFVACLVKEGEQVYGHLCLPLSSASGVTSTSLSPTFPPPSCKDSVTASRARQRIQNHLPTSMSLTSSHLQCDVYFLYVLVFFFRATP